MQLHIGELGEPLSPTIHAYFDCNWRRDVPVQGSKLS